MRKYTLLFLLFPLCVSAKPWGFFAHKKINRTAVYTLPYGLFGFYKQNIDYITDHAVDPDMRRYAVKAEAPRHYLDADHYGANAFDSLPHSWNKAVERYTEDSLNAYGICPWNIEKYYNFLIYAFKEKDPQKILKTSADLGHYIGDGHVPLHTTENYNGQMTNQIGIHGFWESRVPELYSEEYDLMVGKAVYIENVRETIWGFIRESHLALDSVFGYEKELTASFPTDQKYSYETRGNQTIKTYSEAFSRAYSTKLNGMVERRMRQAMLMVGSIWYTAWVNAGQPDLEPISKTKTNVNETDEDKNTKRDFESGKIKGREEPH